MKRHITTVNDLKQYISGGLYRVHEHGHLNIDTVLYAVFGAIVAHSSHVYVLERGGEIKNAIWFEIRGQQLSATYSHRTHAIEIRDRTWSGEVLATFTNHSSLQSVSAFFIALATGAYEGRLMRVTITSASGVLATFHAVRKMHGLHGGVYVDLWEGGEQYINPPLDDTAYDVTCEHEGDPRDPNVLRFNDLQPPPPEHLLP